MKGYFKVFRAGRYPQGTVSKEQVKALADNYDVRYKKSPLTRDHEDGEALGWISSVKAQDGNLWVAFDEISEEARVLNRTGKYRYPSIEIADYGDEELGEKLYLRAVTLTNFNAVRDLPQLRFADGEEINAYSAGCAVYFEEPQLNAVPMQKVKRKPSPEPLLPEVDEADDDVDITPDEVREDEERIDEAGRNPFLKLARLLRKLAGGKNVEIEVAATEDSIVTVFGGLLGKVEDREAEVRELRKERIYGLLKAALSEGRINEAEIPILAEYGSQDIKKLGEMLRVRTLPSIPAALGIGKNNLAYREASEGKLALSYVDILRNPSLAVELSSEELLAIRNNNKKGK